MAFFRGLGPKNRFGDVAGSPKVATAHNFLEILGHLSGF